MKIHVLMVAAALVAGTQANADQKDDVLRSMAKCADVADTLGRLSCFDGATPQLKSVLGLVPPDSTSKLVPVPQASTEAGAQTATATAAPTQEEKESWFGLNPFGKRKAPQTKPEQFGAESLPPEQRASVAPVPEQLDQIAAKVTDYSLNPYGKFIVFLDNGQIWRQADSDSDEARFKRTPGDNSVVISRGAIGSYNLLLNDKNRAFKVIRVK